MNEPVQTNGEIAAVFALSAIAAIVLGVILIGYLSVRP